jgi:hypothetical protein
VKAVTQLLRCYPEPMPYIKKSDKPSKKKLTAADQQEREIVEVANLVGDAWGAWGGPSLVIDFETTTDLKPAIRFGVFQLRGYDFLEIIELTKPNKQHVAISIGCGMRELPTRKQNANQAKLH